MRKEKDSTSKFGVGGEENRNSSFFLFFFFFYFFFSLFFFFFFFLLFFSFFFFFSPSPFPTSSHGRRHVFFFLFFFFQYSLYVFFFEFSFFSFLFSFIFIFSCATRCLSPFLLLPLPLLRFLHLFLEGAFCDCFSVLLCGDVLQGDDDWAAWVCCSLHGVLCFGVAGRARVDPL